MGEGSTERAVATHTLAQEAWPFARPSDQTRRFWFALFNARGYASGYGPSSLFFR